LGGAFALAALLAASSCGAKHDPARRTLDELVAAVEARDPAAIVERLAPDFQAADGTGAADADMTLRRFLAAYESLDVRISDVTIERAADAARARFRADFSGKPRTAGGLDQLVPRTSAYRFDLRLAPASPGGRWLVTWAGWEQLS
jgi:hypothetical protein